MPCGVVYAFKGDFGSTRASNQFGCQSSSSAAPPGCGFGPPACFAIII